jgi:hypothetical protein
MKRTLPILLAAAALLAALAVPVASAGAGTTINSERFHAYHYRVACGVNVQQLGGVTCYSPALPSTELDGYALIHKHGKVQLGERGDSPWAAGSDKLLKKGKRWARVGIVCARKPNAIRCHNRDGHGIRIAPKSYKTF